jgi:excisionase family DNA binding protein
MHITISEAAERLGLGYHAVYAKIKRGEIKAIEGFKGRLYIEPTEFERFMQKRREKLGLIKA